MYAFVTYSSSPLYFYITNRTYNAKLFMRIPLTKKRKWARNMRNYI